MVVPGWFMQVDMVGLSGFGRGLGFKRFRV